MRVQRASLLSATASAAQLLSAGLAAAASVPSTSSSHAPYTKRGMNDPLGLNPANLNADGVAVGFLPAWGEPMHPNDPTMLNKLLPKPMAVIGAYGQIQSSDPTFSQIDKYVQATQAQPGNPPLALALMPDEGLASITPAVANRIAAKMAAINKLGVTVWLRYAHEMNGDWYAWGQQPSAFLASWNLVTNAVRAATNNTYMLWAPNEMYASSNDTWDTRGGYSGYWPGANMVDIVGLSFYHYGTQARLNNLPPDDEALKVMNRFDKLFGSVQNRPFVLAETGASYTRNPQTGVPAPGNATEANIKINWLHQLTGPDTLKALPSLRAITWFEVVKDENAGYNTPVMEEDFRIISQANSSLATYTLAYMASVSVNVSTPNTTGVIGASSSNDTKVTSSPGSKATAIAASATPKNAGWSTFSASSQAVSLSLLLTLSSLALVL